MNSSKTSRKKRLLTKRRIRVSASVAKHLSRPGKGLKTKNISHPDIFEMVEEGLRALNKVKDVKTTMREFDRLIYPAPKAYSPKEIIRLREQKLGMSQAAFAMVCNAKLSTLQKWESGVNKPTPPVNRLFQMIERGGLAFLQGKA